jgi:hypothetical protein
MQVTTGSRSDAGPRRLTFTAYGRDRLAQAAPWQVGMLAGAVATLFMLARIAVAGHGNVAALVVAGSRWVRRPPATSWLPVRPGPGYDGQFYYRIALGPLDWARTAFGIQLDNLARLDRVGYPAIVSALSLAHASLVPAVMVVVNIGAFTVLAWAASTLARDAGRGAAWGLAVAGFSGFEWSMSRDLTEVTEAMFVVVAILALRRGRPVWAGLSLVGAVMSREAALLVVGAVLAERSVGLLLPARSAGTAGHGGRHPRRVLGADDAAWALPGLAFAAWQVALRLREGEFPVLRSGHRNVGLPLSGLLQGARHYLDLLPQTGAMLWFWELGVLLVVGGFAAFSLRSSRALGYEKLAWLGALVLGVLLGPAIWSGNVGFRSLDDFYVLSYVIALSSRAQLRAPALLGGLTWAAVAVELVRFI